ncbi:MAG: hypothetical protein JWM80_6651 [Cyanobacteria bacterium RYN_339]|nr:hypothetical protein [Cyanobacteria bacterium RYN_339]
MMRFPMFVTLAMACGLACLDGCGPGSGSQPSGVTVIPAGQQPLVGSFASAPVSLPYTAPPGSTPTPGAASGDSDASAAAKAGGDFRDDFSGDGLDSGVWDSGAQAGLIQVGSGYLDMFTAGNAKSYPFVVTARPIVPEQGPFFVEWRYKIASGGQQPATALDAAPPRKLGDSMPTAPFFYATTFYTSRRFYFEGHYVGDGVKGLALNTEHKVRVEVDANDKARVIFDGGQIGQAIAVKKRPKYFYSGPDALKDGTAIAWGRLQLDFVAAGVLNVPDPATPPPVAPAPTAKPAATPTPKPTTTTAATAAPTATPTTAATATPTPAPTATPTPSPSPTTTADPAATH